VVSKGSEEKNRDEKKKDLLCLNLLVKLIEDPCLDPIGFQSIRNRRKNAKTTRKSNTTKTYGKSYLMWCWGTVLVIPGNRWVPEK
jgi:hypothetical protein